MNGEIEATRATAGQFGHPADGGLIEREVIEAAAKIIYERGMLFMCTGKPAWVPGGNSIAQVEARAIVAAIRALPAAQDGAELEADDILYGLGRVADAMGVNDLRLLAQSAMWRIQGLTAKRDALKAEVERKNAEIARLRKALGDEQDSADEMADVLSEWGDGLMFDVDRLQVVLDQHDALRESALRAAQKGDV